MRFLAAAEGDAAAVVVVAAAEMAPECELKCRTWIPISTKEKREENYASV